MEQSPAQLRSGHCIARSKLEGQSGKFFSSTFSKVDNLRPPSSKLHKEIAPLWSQLTQATDCWYLIGEN